MEDNLNQPAAENRRNPRRKIRTPVVIYELENGERKGKGMDIVTKDLSADGIAFYASSVYTINSVFSLDIFLPNQKNPIACMIQVVSVETMFNKKDEYVIGACMIDLKDDERILIAKTLDKLDLYILLASAVQAKVSDMHLTIGKHPMVRKDGRILGMQTNVIEEGQVEAMLYPLLNSTQIEYFEKHKELDFAFSPNLHSRFRVNMHYQKGHIEATLRNVPTTIDNFASLHLPVDIIHRFCGETSGLVLIAGQTGAGKTTTMSAIVDHINKTQERVVITIEDPVEYTFVSERSIVKQRELGEDTESYSEALKRALRQDPDVICVGEILDADCFLSAMRAAETGHLVISTIHAPDAISAVERAISLFPPEHAEYMRQQLSSCLLGVLYQTLIPCLKGGRILATELLLNNGAIKNLIREGKYSQMSNVIQTGKHTGMYPLETTLKELVSQKMIEKWVLDEHTDREMA